MVFSYDMPKLTTLNTKSLNGSLEQCQQKGLDDNRIVAQNYDWDHQIPIIELLMHCKTMVTHGKQSNDAIIQTALKQIRFDINLSDVSSVDKITLNIRNTLMRDFPSKSELTHNYNKLS